MIVGTRPEIIKASCLVKRFQREKDIELQIWHTGQHYDFNMSEVFYKELGIKPDHNFEIGSGTFATQLARLSVAVEAKFNEYKPDLVVLIGDTNSTIGVALTAKKMSIPIAHIEAGCRENIVRHINGKPVFNRNLFVMDIPEESNRMTTDICSELLFAINKEDFDNLSNDILGNKYLSGDLTLDAFMIERERAKTKKTLQELCIPDKYVLVTLHRVENIDSAKKLREIVSAFLEATDVEIVFPMHPHTRKKLEELNLYLILTKTSHIHICPPVMYHDMINLMAHASKIVTDSGGVQKEAYFLRVPCVALRNFCPFKELIKSGVISLIDVRKNDIVKSLRELSSFPETIRTDIFGNGEAANNIVSKIKEWWTLKTKTNYRILLGTPFRNEEHSIPQYVEGLLKLDYPKELIDVIWVDTNSVDRTLELLNQFRDKIVEKFKYHSFKVVSMSSFDMHFSEEEMKFIKSVKGALDQLPEEKLHWYKKGINDPRSVEYILGSQNFILDQMIDEHDFVLLYFADVVTPPYLLKRYIEDMKDYPDAGWVGGVMHAKVPNHRSGVSLYVKFEDDRDLNNPNYPWSVNTKVQGYPYHIRGITEKEIIERQMSGKGVFSDVCSTGHVFLMRKCIVMNKLRFRFGPTESSLMTDLDMIAMGYKMYCDSFVYIQHISVDGRIYRHSLSMEISEEERLLLRESRKQSKNNLVLITNFPQKNSQWCIALKRYAEKLGMMVQFLEVMFRHQKLSESDSFWIPLKEADLVFVYSSRYEAIYPDDFKVYDWWEFPKFVRKFMKPKAIMISQWDDDFLWLTNPDSAWWGPKMPNPDDHGSPEQFFNDTKILEVPDAMVSALNDPLFKSYTDKPIIQLHLPHLVTRSIKDYPEFHASHKVGIICHSGIGTSITHSLDNLIISKDIPVSIFNTNSGRDFTCKSTFYFEDRKLPYGSRIYARAEPDEYMDLLWSGCRIGLDDNDNYLGWSRFAIECALTHTPCVGSSPAVKVLFPELYTEKKDYKTQFKLIEMLKIDEKFCKFMAITGFKRCIKLLDTEALCTKLIQIFDVLRIEKPENAKFGNTKKDVVAIRQAIDKIIETVEEEERFRREEVAEAEHEMLETLTRREREQMLLEKEAIEQILHEERVAFIKFLAHAYPKTVSNRPITSTQKVFDPIANRIMTQVEWDTRYGKWKTLLEDKERLLKLIKIALESDE